MEDHFGVRSSEGLLIPILEPHTRIIVTEVVWHIRTDMVDKYAGCLDTFDNLRIVMACVKMS
jgi:hypothetical protein